MALVLGSLELGVEDEDGLSVLASGYGVKKGGQVEYNGQVFGLAHYFE